MVGSVGYNYQWKDGRVAGIGPVCVRYNYRAPRGVAHPPITRDYPL